MIQRRDLKYFKLQDKLAVDIKSSELCVLKTIQAKQLKTIQDKNTLQREINAYNKIKQFNDYASKAGIKSYLIDQKEIIQDERQTTIIQKYAYLGDLRILMKTFQNLPEKFVIKVLKQICLGLQQLHRLGLVSRDIKPENILFDRMCNVIITDFGTSKDVDKFEYDLMTGAKSYKNVGNQIKKQMNEENIRPEFTTMSLVGTITYFAPEQYRGQCDFLYPIDIYALGCIAFELFTGKTYNSVTKLIREEYYKKWKEQGKDYIIQFIKQTTNKDPRERFDGGYNKLLSLPIFTKFQNIECEQLVDPLIVKHILDQPGVNKQIPIREESLIRHDNYFNYYLLRHELIEHFLIDVKIELDNQQFLADICVTNFNKFVVINKEKGVSALQFYLTYQDFEITKIYKRYKIIIKQTVQNSTINIFHKIIFQEVSQSIQNFVTNVKALFTSQIFDFCQYCQDYTISNNMCNVCGRIKYQEQTGNIKQLTIQQNYFLTNNNDKLQSLMDENTNYQCNISVYLQRKNRLHIRYDAMNEIINKLDKNKNLIELIQQVNKNMQKRGNTPDTVEFTQKQHEIRALLAHIYQISYRQLEGGAQYKMLPRINQLFDQGKFSIQLIQFYDFLANGCLDLSYEGINNKESEQRILQDVDYTNTQLYIPYKKLVQNQERKDFLEEYYNI